MLRLYEAEGQYSLPIVTSRRRLSVGNSHRDTNTLTLCELLRFFIPGVCMARHSDSGIVVEDALDALGHEICSIRDSDLAGMLGVADAYTAAVVNRNPTGAAGGVQQGI